MRGDRRRRAGPRLSASSAAVGSSSSQSGAGVGDERGPARAAAAARPTASGTANRRRVERKGRESRVERSSAPGRSAAQRGPETPSVSRTRQRRLDRIEMADIVQPRAIARRDRPRPASPPHSSRPAAGASRVASRRNRLDLPLPLAPVSTSAPPAGSAQREPGEDQPLAAPAGELLGDELTLAAIAAVETARSPARHRTKKAAPEGEFRSRVAPVRSNRPDARFGGQTCKD